MSPTWGGLRGTRPERYIRVPSRIAFVAGMSVCAEQEHPDVRRDARRATGNEARPNRLRSPRCLLQGHHRKEARDTRS